MSQDLFNEEKLGGKIQEQLPENYRIRPLRATDFQLGHVHLLGQLTEVGTFDAAQYKNIFDRIQHQQHTFIVVIEEINPTARIVASGSIVIELKFIHEGGLVGHIEDIVVSDVVRGKNFGKRIIEQLVDIGRKEGCYKIILNCTNSNAGFYEKCGFRRKEVEMVMRFDE